jgi:phloretin hydrolase
MELRSLLVRMGNVFPDPVTMEDIRKMKRRDLTEAEKARPYAKYFHKEMAEIPAEDLAKVNAGPVDPTKVTTVQKRNDLLKPGYLEVETGYTVMPDGSGCACTLVNMPGVTPEMFDWWFNWHPLESLRVAMWSPVAHFYISVKDPARHLDSSGVPRRERFYGITHDVVEGFNVATSQKEAIKFFSPQDYGLDMGMFKEPEISRAICINVATDIVKTPLSTAMHAVREVDGGVEYRSRYWLGYTMKNGTPVRVKRFIYFKPFKMRDLARNMCMHSLLEYNNLASFLPKLYEEMDGII